MTGWRGCTKIHVPHRDAATVRVQKGEEAPIGGDRVLKGVFGQGYGLRGLVTICQLNKTAIGERERRIRGNGGVVKPDPVRAVGGAAHQRSSRFVLVVLSDCYRHNESFILQPRYACFIEPLLHRTRAESVLNDDGSHSMLDEIVVQRVCGGIPLENVEDEGAWVSVVEVGVPSELVGRAYVVRVAVREYVSACLEFGGLAGACVIREDFE